MITISIIFNVILITAVIYLLRKINERDKYIGHLNCVVEDCRQAVDWKDVYMTRLCAERNKAINKLNKKNSPVIHWN